MANFKLTPAEILEINRKNTGIDSIFDTEYIRTLEARRNALKQAMATEDREEPSPSLFEQAKSGVGGALQPIGSALDMGRAAMVAGGVELGDLVGGALGVETAGGDASIQDFRENFNRRIGVGDVLEENTLTTDLPLNVKRVLGATGDIAIDPLNALTLGTGTAAKNAIKTIAKAEGDDLARLAAKEGVEAADRELVKRAATKTDELGNLRERRAWTTARDPQADRFADARGLPSGTPAVDRGPAGRAVQLFDDDAAQRALGDLGPATVRPTSVAEILGREGFDERSVGRALSALERRGRGGIQFAGRQVVQGDTLKPLTSPFGGEVASAIRQSKAGQEFRKGLIPFTRTRDKFGEAVTEAMPSIAHRRAAAVNNATRELDRKLKPLVKKVNSDDVRHRILAALDVGGDVDSTLLALRDEGLFDSANLLQELRDTTYRSYDDMLRAGYREDQLFSRDEYIRHVLTDEGAERIGLNLDDIHRGRPGKGRLKQRIREGSVLEQNEDFGIVGYVDDPAKLVRSSYHYAQEVLGNKHAWEELDRLAKATGQDLTSTTARKGFTQVAPDAFVDNTIARDLFELSKAGTQHATVRAWDTFSALVKRHTLFNPISFGPYFTQNMATGIGINTVDGVRSLHYRMAAKLHSVVKRGLDDVGEEGLDNYLARHLTPDEARLAKELRRENIFSADGFTIYDDVAEARPLRLEATLIDKLKTVGTNNTVKINSWGEEMLRGSSYIKKRLHDGLSASASADLVRNRHLDYSAIGRTAFERNAINRFVFFPTWLMRAPAAIVRAYAERPGIALGQARFEMGTHWYDRERNEYDELLGPRLSGPMAFMSGAGDEGLGALTDPLSIANPAVTTLLDPDSRELRDVIPPLTNVLGGDYNVEGEFPGRQDERSPHEVGRPGRLQGVLNDPLRRDIYLASLLGVRTGVDRGAMRDEADLSEAVAERQQIRGEAPTPRQTLALMALNMGIDDAASMNQGELTRALRDEGVPESTIARILSGR